MSFQKLLNNKQFKQALECAEQEVYIAAYQYTKYNQSAAAKLLGVARGTFINKIRRYHV